MTAFCSGKFCVGAVTGGFQVWVYVCEVLESVIVHLFGWANPLFLELFSEVSHQHWDYTPFSHPHTLILEPSSKIVNVQWLLRQ